MAGGRGWGPGALSLLLLSLSAVTADASPAGPVGHTHTVARGETLWQIARAHGVSVDAIASVNGLADPASLPVGRNLRIPASTSALTPRPALRQGGEPTRPPAQYRVKAGDNLWGLAQRYGTTVAILLRLNGLSEDAVLRIGQPLRVPAQQRGRPGLAPRSPGTPGAVGGARSRAPGMRWPSRGVVTSRFGLRHRRLHAGIDIALRPRVPVMSVRSGIVTFAGRLGGYGLLVVVDHGAGLTTRYGHLASLGVRVGQRVAAGEAIGAVGRTGNATGWILHFEIRKHGRPTNPLPVLGKARSG